MTRPANGAGSRGPGRALGLDLLREGAGAGAGEAAAVLPGARGAGAGPGPAASGHLHGLRAEAGYRRMTLWTHESHRAACALYAKAGFACVRSEPVRPSASIWWNRNGRATSEGAENARFPVRFARAKRSRPARAGRSARPRAFLLQSRALGAIPPASAALAQLVRALDCGSRGPPFKPGRRYHHLSQRSSANSCSRARLSLS
jgi:hypothetical protein